MKKLPASIFNDVIGPVMRGPSSSHVAGGARIAELVRQSLLPSPVKRVVCDFDPTGSLAFSHTGQGTDMGFACGLMDIDLASPEVDRYPELLREHGITVEYRILKYGAVHPGNYRIEAEAADGTIRHWQAVSVGGGMVEMQELDGFPVSIAGDFHELLIEADLRKTTAEALVKTADSLLPAPEFALEDRKEDRILLNRKFTMPVDESTLSALRELPGVICVITLAPILPTHSSASCAVPFRNAAELLTYAEQHPMDAWKYALLYETMRGSSTEEDAIHRMDHILRIMEEAVASYHTGTSYSDRILGPQAYKMDEKKEFLIPAGPTRTVIRNITAVMENKSAMGLIVAAPTVGSCGCLPGTVIGLGRELGKSREDMIHALFTAGLIGVFFAEEATFSAEVAGCQVECGAASGMTAAAVTEMMGGSIRQCVDAASFALQNITGLACDPVANRVEIPCLGKNVMAGMNAIACSDMILAGYDAVIPLDETIGAIFEIGKSLPLSLRCTCGGLGATKTSMRITKELEERR